MTAYSTSDITRACWVIIHHVFDATDHDRIRIMESLRPEWLGDLAKVLVDVVEWRKHNPSDIVLYASDKNSEMRKMILDMEAWLNTRNSEIPQYINIVREAWMSRELRSAVNMDDLKRAVEIVECVKRSHMKELKISRVGDFGVEYLKELEDRMQHKRVFFETGLATLDAMLYMKRKRTVVFAGRPGRGKSSILIWIAQNMIMQGHSVLYLTNEMAREDVADKMVMGGIQIHGTRLTTGDITAHDLANIASHLSEIDKRKFWIAEQPSFHIDDIKRALDEIRPDVLMVDYMQRFNLKSENQASALSEIANELKTIALERDVLLLEASQVDRESDHRTRGVKMVLADLKGSGGLEEAADSVILMNLEAEGDANKGDILELNLAKNRHGETGKCYAAFIKPYCTWKDVPNWNKDIPENT